MVMGDININILNDRRDVETYKFTMAKHGFESLINIIVHNMVDTSVSSSPCIDRVYSRVSDKCEWLLHVYVGCAVSRGPTSRHCHCYLPH